jgi:hypothetical protein
MDTAPVSVGIDVAKEQLDVALGAEGSTWSVPNDEAGIGPCLPSSGSIPVRSSSWKLRAASRSPP